MKYIRTKDGIYELTKWQCDLSGEMILVKADNKFGNDKVFTRDIIEQADTIEELVDGYYVDKNKEVFIEDEVYESGSDNRIQWLRPYLISCVSKGIDVYAFIKTDKGLIYVAKMNKIGELELL